MRITATRVLLAAWLLAMPAAALAQTSSIAGVVKDPSGALLPGVTVEATSPALIEKVRSASSDGAGQYKIINLVPGTYTVTFTLPGFNSVRRDGIVLTSDFTATVSVEMKVGAVEETITVVAESPVVDTQNITTRTVMTREVLDSIPTGRNIQAVGIMIPGTSLSPGGGGALSRDVGGSGSLQQSPLQFRGSGDTVQTIEGMRLNNLCANGAYSGVYWNDGSFQEISYVTGADTAEMGQGGMRVNMVPKDGGNQFRGVVFGNYAPSDWASDNCGSPGIGQPCTRKELSGDLTFNKNNRLTNVPKIRKIYDFNPSAGGPILRNRLWFYATYRYWGLEKTVADSFFDADPSPFRYIPDTSRPGIDDGHIRSVSGRISWQFSDRDKVSYYHDDQNKVRGHWGISSTVPPEASAIQETPTSFVSVSKWTRTQTNRLLFDAGFAVYNQQYNEIYQPSVFEGSVPLVTVFDSTSGKFANAWNNPAEHYSKLFTEQFAANYVTGSHSMRIGATISQAKWRLVRRRNGDVERVTFNNGTPSSVTLAIPTDRRNEITADMAVFAQDKWTFRRATINAGLRWDYFAAGSDDSILPASAYNSALTFSKCSDGKNNLAEGCTGRVTSWKDINPRVGVSLDLFGTGRTALKGSVARYVAGIGLAGIVDESNPANSVGLTDTRGWTDADGNGSPFDAGGNLQFNELRASTNTNFGRNIPSTTTTDPDVLNGWGKRGYNWEYTISMQHELMPRMSVAGGWYRRKFGNQTITVDQRFSFEKNSYDGPFCVNAPSNPNLPNSGGYQVCGLYDLKPSVAANPGPANSLLTFSENYGGETNIYQGWEISVNARPKTGMFVQAGVNAQKRNFNQCALLDYGVYSLTATGTTVSEIFPNGQRACEQDLPYRPDFKLFGSYTLPFDIQFAGTYQFSRGIQNGGAAPSLLATWATPASATTLGRPYANNVTTRTFNLIAVGENYGNYDLNQLDIRLSKRIRMGRMRLRVDGDLYNVFNSNWPYTVSSIFSTSTTAAAWQRPTNVLQARFFKLGAHFDF